jgi:hypothetical protein
VSSRLRIISFIIVINCNLANEAFAQGCSDAGFCTIGSMKHNTAAFDSLYKSTLSFSFTSGLGDQDVFVFTPGIQYDRIINNNWAIQSKITGNYSSGDLGKAYGAGDLFLSGSYAISESEIRKHVFTMAFKFPLNLSDLRTMNQALPLTYQSSLGTIDWIGGYTFNSNLWLFSIAYQQPLTGTNRNTFLPEYRNTQEAFNYSPTNDFKRKADALLRVGYTINKFKKAKINLGLLSIYHLGNDTYINANISNSPILLEGSEGLTINVTGAINFKINKRMSAGINGGIPIVVRDSRPDGLTRSFVISPEINLKF